MDVSEQIEKFKDFIEVHYSEELHELIQKGEKSLVLDFSLIEDVELREALLESPEELIKAAENALDQFDLPEDCTLDRVRFKNLPESQNIMIGGIRSKHLGEFLCVEGIVRQASDIRPQVTCARFECQGCGNTISILQLDSKFKEPSRCTCGMRGRFRQLSQDLVDAQHVKIEEPPEMLEGGAQPKRLSIFLKEDLVDPKMEKKCTPGSKIRIVGIVKEVPVLLKTGAKSVRYDIILEANNIESIQEEYSDLILSKEDIDEIETFAKSPDVYEKFTKSIAPSIWGHEKIKGALVLQLLGGSRKEKSDGTVMRGDIHILLCGDPGSGKSQLLQFITKAAPKARFVSGKGASGAGITASVIKDEFLKGWCLEAGALVLANNGIAVVDELDKMSPEDRSALHEALEQQSYHSDFKISFVDGTACKIGLFVDQLIEENYKNVVKGKDCEILSINNYKVLTTDFNKIYPVNIDRVSRHKAPKYFFEIKFSNGRKILVTPEHPFFVFKNGKYQEISADQLKEGSFIPAPRFLPFRSEKKCLKKVVLNRMNKDVNLPLFVDLKFARFLGYFVSEGHSYLDLNNHYAEVGISNTDSFICADVAALFSSIFKTKINTHIALARSWIKANLDLKTSRCCSLPLYYYLKENFDGLMFKAPFKYIPNTIRNLSLDCKLEFLRAAFRGDGFIDSERFGYSTASYELAKGYSDLLLEFSCWNYIAEDIRSNNIIYYKVVISGFESMNFFLEKIVELNDYRYTRIFDFCNRSKLKLNDRDLLPLELVKSVYDLLKDLRLSDGSLFTNIKRKQNAHVKKIKYYLNKVENNLSSIDFNLNVRVLRRKLNIPINEIANRVGCSNATIYNFEKRNDVVYIDLIKEIAKKKLEFFNDRVFQIKSVIDSDLRFVTIKSIKKIENKTEKWVYDVTVEPNHAFISEGLVLHNTVTISKANIQATLRARATLLAAANPKFGRFDPFTPLAGQIDLPPALINRFDLIFPIRDIPDKVKDEAIASHVLESTIADTSYATEVSPKFLRKYIAYVRQKINPTMSRGAINEIKNFYVTLRNSGTTDNQAVKPIPISARQLEALIRLSEASAKVRLDTQVRREDAQRAVELLKYCLMQVGFDPETGQIDIDRISSGITAAVRNKIMAIKEIIAELEAKGFKEIPIEEVIASAAKKGIEESKVEEAIEKLKRSGDIFEPKRGFLAKI